MKTILIIGAGLSTKALIDYLLFYSEENHWHIRVGDLLLHHAQKKINNHRNASAFQFNIKDLSQRSQEISSADIVISMIPASMHIIVAKECIRYKKNLITPSYLSEELENMNDEASAKGLLFLNEMGVDPGIDHMSAMSIIDRIKEKGGKITSFKSFAGGLVAPKYDNNPWNYKISWNPKNIVLAGNGVAIIREVKKTKYIPYSRVFRRIEPVYFKDYGEFEVYANRNSLVYEKLYKIGGVETIIRGTLRRKNFCRAWNIFVNLGCTDDSYEMQLSKDNTYKDYINSFLPYDENTTIEKKFSEFTNIQMDSDIMNKMKWLGIFTNEKIGISKPTPAQVLQKIIEKKWRLEEEEKDLLVMQHHILYELNNQKQMVISSLAVEGDNNINTAMAKTVGLPIPIATKLILNNEINLNGVLIPTHKQIYEPILNELKQFGIIFNEEKFEV